MNQKITNGSNRLQCNLHGQPFSLYCDRCLQPVCQKCTFIGPHNTAIHSLTPLHQAYERRVQEINTRLSKLSQSREVALTKITIWTGQIQKLKLQYQQIRVQNDKNRAQIEHRLQKCYQNIISSLIKEEQNILAHLNEINDLGHEFETLSITSDIECLINYQRIIGEFRQIIDQLEILIDKKIETEQLPKQLSDLRVKLKSIQSFEELFKIKINIIKELIIKATQEIKKIQTPAIEYEAMLVEINRLLARYEDSEGQFSLNCEKPTRRKMHFVCHFCGIILDDYTINTSCTKNQLGEPTKSTESYFKAYSKVEVNKEGYCRDQPQMSSFGTHRHFFGVPANPNLFFRTAYLNSVLSKQVVGFLLTFLPGSASQLQIINQSTKIENNSFLNYLQLLFVKMMTLMKIKSESIQRLFKKQDIGQTEKIGYCECIAMQYILMEIIGLTQKQAQVVLSICDYQLDGRPEFKGRKEIARNYQQLVEKLKQIKI